MICVLLYIILLDELLTDRQNFSSNIYTIPYTVNAQRIIVTVLLRYLSIHSISYKDCVYTIMN